MGSCWAPLHQATASFQAPPQAVWQPWTLHRSLAGPTDRLDELAVSGWWNAQLHDDDIAEIKQITSTSTDSTTLWTLAWQTRAAAWMLRHRSLLERAIQG